MLGCTVSVRIDDSIRHHLTVLARRKRARVVEFRRDRPIDWRPHTVRDPSVMPHGHFTEAGAWELIATKLEAGHDVKPISLENPPGATGYVMLIELAGC